MQEKNYAFIDGQNLYQGIAEQGWKLDYARFRVYLREKHKVMNAYLFMGYMSEYEYLYEELRNSGYILKFKPVLNLIGYQKRGNVDADLVLNIMIHYIEYDKALIVTSDGDFDTTIMYLESMGKFKIVLSPRKEECSALLKKAARGKLAYFEAIRHKVETIPEAQNEKAPL